MNNQSYLSPEQTACVYAWMAQLFAHELDDKKLAELSAQEMSGWFALLKGDPSLTQAVNKFESMLSALQLRPDARLELAADFCSLFLMSDKHSALPYGSIYLKDSHPQNDIKGLLLEAGMQVSDDFHEPMDHVSIFLELLSHLYFCEGEQHTDTHQVAQLQQATLSLFLRWLPDFTQACAKYDEFGFYASLSQLLLAFVRREHRN